MHLSKSLRATIFSIFLSATLIQASALHADDRYPMTLKLAWPWIAPENGSYEDRWAENYGSRYLIGSWTSDPDHRLEILVNRLAPMHYWRNLPKIGKRNLEMWTFLEGTGVDSVQALNCSRGNCASFDAGDFDCAGFVYANNLGGPNDGGGDEGGDMIWGYYCVNPAKGDARTQLNQILPAIVVNAE